MLVQYLQYYSDGGAEIYFFAMERGGREKSDAAESLKKMVAGIKEIHLLPLPGIAASLYNVILHSLLLSRKSIQESFFFSGDLQRRVLCEAQRIEPDIIFCDMLRTAQYFEGCPKVDARRIFGMDDILSDRYRSFLDNPEINILGNFVAKVPRFLDVVANTLLRKAILKTEAERIRNREIECIRSYDHTIVISPTEAKEMRARSGRSTVSHIYPAVQLAKTGEDAGATSFPSLSFMGLLNIPHNEKGLCYFLDKVFPIVVSKVPDVRFLIIGGNATTAVKELASRMPRNVELLGYVEDFVATISSTAVFVNPVYFGTGIKTKVVEVMNIGVPVVTTPVGAEGLHVTHGRELLIGKSDSEFVENIITLLRNRELRRSVSIHAKEYIRKYHDRDVVSQQFMEIVSGFSA
ncbi:glycosyl transferase, group 1 [Geotalea uraniireducens Rf4]|uniref:Glycosyl transferase, group 1 n=2 Tax=Geotalea uraniireducens TaxID=351604 RepID=A5G6C5_GEOUR|nr:glycosyl transferase, group 1 [Geotalea uraniireducens Rf4]